MIGFFSNFVATGKKACSLNSTMTGAAVMSKDVQYFVVKGGLSLVCKLIGERKKLPMIIATDSNLIQACLGVIACSA